jgi:hypothetical protein
MTALFGGLKGLEIQLVGYAENTKRSKKSQPLRMTALSGAWNKAGWTCRRHEKIEKVTCSRDGKEEGGAFLLRAEETLGAVFGGYGFWHS